VPSVWIPVSPGSQAPSPQGSPRNGGCQSRDEASPADVLEPSATASGAFDSIQQFSQQIPPDPSTALRRRLFGIRNDGPPAGGRPPRPPRSPGLARPPAFRPMVIRVPKESHGVFVIGGFDSVRRGDGTSNSLVLEDWPAPRPAPLPPSECPDCPSLTLTPCPRRTPGGTAAGPIPL